MNKVKEYFSETTNELFHKVSWPTWSELQSSAIVVAIASVNKGMQVVYHLF
jgi:preprotein translocase subunit SecE